MEKSTTYWLIFAVIILVLIITSFWFYAIKFNYKPFTIDDQGCEHYEKSCTCIGLLRILETYPEQYDCQGWEICKDIDIVKCE